MASSVMPTRTCTGSIQRAALAHQTCRRGSPTRRRPCRRSYQVTLTRTNETEFTPRFRSRRRAPAARWRSERLRSVSMLGSRPRWCGLVGLLVALALLASAPATVARAGVGVAESTLGRATPGTSTPVVFRLDGSQQGATLSRVQRSEQSLAAAIDGSACAIAVDVQLQALASRDSSPSPACTGGASSRAPPLSF
jgi:hypothetical protein